jgi:hypothetical protein
MAAQIMKREDIGPVLVVSDYNSQNLVGIVTDRDLAVKVIAEGRDPHNTRIDEVMSHSLVTCRPNDATGKAVQLMAQNQVRRIPIVDAGNRLLGIVAQADLARREDEQDVGEMVEEISQPYGAASWETSWSRSSGHHGTHTGTYGEATNGSHYDVPSIASSLALGAVCLGVGAGMMYMFDPNRGRARRGFARDKAVRWYNASGEAVSKTTEDFRNRATGMAATTKHWFAKEPVSDDKLAARIRSKMGRYVSQPHAIDVEVNNGIVCLRGSILAHEASRLLKCVKGVPGVQDVENRLESQETGTSADAYKSGEQWDFMKKNWSPTTRMMASAVGGGLLLYGMKSRNSIGAASATVGLGLLTRGIANREFTQMTGISDLRRLVGA